MDRLPPALVRRRKRQSPEEWFLGPLEARVLRALIDAGPGSVSDVAQRLRPELAYTTVMTELGMLHRIGLADREKDGRGYRYKARMNREQLRQAMAAELLTQVREDFGEYAREVESGRSSRSSRLKRKKA